MISIPHDAEGLVVLGAVLVLQALLIGGVVVRARRLRTREQALREAVRAREQTAAELERAGARNALLLAAVADGIVGVDADTSVTFVNPAAARMLGYASESDAVGRPVAAVLGSVIADEVRASIAAGGANVERTELFALDGRRFDAQYSLTPLVEAGEIAGAVITFHDITERREVERMKDEFVSLVSHELRTPLTSIRGSLGLLATGKLGELQPQGTRMLEIAIESADRLVRLINDILDLERMEAGRADLDRRPLDLLEVVQKAIDEMQVIASRAEVQLSLRGRPVTAHADRDRLLQVLTNLISNAIKFTDPGGLVAVVVERSDADEHVVRVRNRGRLIPTDRLESIFERFQQVDSSDARKKGGTGLGLAICRWIVQQHGGRIWAESDPAGGTVFTFTLPRAAPLAAAAAGPAASPISAPSASPRASAPAEIRRPAGPPHVLVVEDEQPLAEVLLEMFRRHDIPAQYATTASYALRLAERALPAMLLLDLMLPGRDGQWLVDQFRADDALRETPLVVYTARDLTTADQERLRLGPTEFVTKGRLAPQLFEQRVIELFRSLTDGRPPHTPESAGASSAGPGPG
jgi:PAS domain S-box-containing protein